MKRTRDFERTSTTSATSKTDVDDMCLFHKSDFLTIRRRRSDACDFTVNGCHVDTLPPLEHLVAWFTYRALATFTYALSPEAKSKPIWRFVADDGYAIFFAYVIHIELCLNSDSVLPLADTLVLLQDREKASRIRRALSTRYFYATTPPMAVALFNVLYATFERYEYAYFASLKGKCSELVRTGCMAMHLLPYLYVLGPCLTVGPPFPIVIGRVFPVAIITEAEVLRLLAHSARLSLQIKPALQLSESLIAAGVVL